MALWSGMVAPHNGKLRMTEQLIRRTAHRLAALARDPETTGERIYCMKASHRRTKMLQATATLNISAQAWNGR